MPSKELHPAAQPIESLLADCELRRERRSGPGGQHRNKVETAVVVTHVTTGLIGEASERRSQEQNRKMAVRRLRTKLALEVRSSVAHDAQPSQLWQSRCHGRRVDVAESHPDFPALLAEALDVLEAYDLKVRSASAHLGCSTTQLVKLLKVEPRAIALVNQKRAKRRLPPLR